MEEVGNLDQVLQSENPGNAKADRIKLANDFDEFLLLLTTELQHQDPTEPMDSHEFTSQLVQFASVEQAINSNENLESIVGLLTANGVDAGVEYLGQVVEADGNAGFLVDGSAPFVYSLPAQASSASVVITDSLGRTVYTGEGSTQEGKNTVIWDGVGNFQGFNGQQMPDGDYYLLASARDINDEPMEVTTFTSGVVTAVNNDAGEITVSVGNLPVPIEEISGVRVFN